MMRRRGVSFALLLIFVKHTIVRRVMFSHCTFITWLFSGQQRVDFESLEVIYRHHIKNNIKGQRNQ